MQIDPPQPLFPDFPQLRQAREAWQQGKMQQAIELFEAARRAAPTSIRARVEYARALGQVYEVVAAEQLLAEAREIASGDAIQEAAIAPVYAQIHRPHLAMELLEDLRKRAGLSLPALAALAVHYERCGRLTDAASVVDEVVQAAPHAPEARLMEARIARRVGDTVKAQNSLEQALTAAAASPALLAEVWAEQGTLLDQSGEYSGAWNAFATSKSYDEQLPHIGRLRKHSESLQESFCQLYGSLDQTTVDRWLNTAPPSVPGVEGFANLIGFPRSGTTLLEQILAANPELVVSSERGIFCDHVLPVALAQSGQRQLSVSALDGIPLDQLQRSRQRYIACSLAVEGVLPGRRIHLDKNPNHTSLSAALLRLMPEAKFLFMIRDPRDVLISTYLRHFPLTEFSVRFLRFAELVDLYVSEMENWRRFRALVAGRWMEIRYEQLVDDHQATAQKAAEFLGLSWTEPMANYRSRLVGRRVNSPSHDAVRRPVYNSAIGRWHHYANQLAPTLDRLEPIVRVLGY